MRQGRSSFSHRRLPANFHEPAHAIRVPESRSLQFFSLCPNYMNHGADAEYHVLEGIRHYGVYSEKAGEAVDIALAFYNKHLGK